MSYLDNAATTKLDDVVRDTIIETLDIYYANPSALYSDGFRSHKLLEDARKVIAKRLGCDTAEVFFTGSGTESNNIAITGGARARKNFGDEIVLTGYEHPSVYETVESLKKEGFHITTVNPSSNGTVSCDEIINAVTKNTALVTVMHVNNEIGSIIDVVGLAKRVKEINPRTAFHCDMIQSFMKYPVTLANSRIDTASVSAHKIHGPKGVGAVYIRKGFHIETIIHGGNQEGGIRSGTENVIYANAFAVAADRYKTEETTAHVKKLNLYLREKLSCIDGVTINSTADASAYILNFSIPGYRSENILHLLDSKGIMVSSGAACSKGSISHTLKAMGLPKSILESSIRVSFSKDNCKEDIDRLIESLSVVKDNLLSTKPRNN